MSVQNRARELATWLQFSTHLTTKHSFLSGCTGEEFFVLCTSVHIGISGEFTRGKGPLLGCNCPRGWILKKGAGRFHYSQRKQLWSVQENLSTISSGTSGHFSRGWKVIQNFKAARKRGGIHTKKKKRYRQTPCLQALLYMDSFLCFPDITKHRKYLSTFS